MTQNDLLELTGNWTKSFADAHNIQLLAGISQEEKRYNEINASGKKFENNEMSLLGQAQEDFTVGGSKTRSGLRSVFGRLNYNYKLRYMLTASLRYDGSSRFASGNKWGLFPSVSLGWNMANEKFWTNIKETVNTMKVRLSYGGLGNQNIGLYQYIPKLSSNTDDLNYPLGGKTYLSDMQSPASLQPTSNGRPPLQEHRYRSRLLQQQTRSISRGLHQGYQRHAFYKEHLSLHRLWFSYCQ